MFDYSRIPDAMKRERRWLCWAGVPGMKNGKPKIKKVPIDAKTLYSGNPHSPQTWASFEQAVSAIGKPCQCSGGNYTVTGIGFDLGDGWGGVDVDGGEQHGGGVIPQAVLKEFSLLGTYAEVSQSGSGYHFIGRFTGEALTPCKFPTDGMKPEIVSNIMGSGNPYGVEIYEQGRFLALTGNVYNGLDKIADITEMLPVLHHKYIVERQAAYQMQAGISAKTSGGTSVNVSSGEAADFLRLNIDSILNAIVDLANDESTYWRVGEGLFLAGFDYSVWDEWCMRGAGYNERENHRRWNKFSAARAKNPDATIKWLVSEAQKRGWKPVELTDSFKRKSAAEEFDGLTVHTAQPAQAPAPETFTFEDAGAALKELHEITGNPDYKPIATGFPGLDSMMNGGFDPGTMSIIMAAPATGKTALVMQIAENIARAGSPVLVFNLEMSKEQLVARTLSRLTAEKALESVPNPLDGDAVSGVQAMYTNKWWTLGPGQRKRLEEAEKAFSGYSGNLYLVTDAIREYTDIIKRVKAFTAQKGRAPVVIVDYLQLLFTDGKTSAVYSAKDVALGLKQEIARDLQTHVILLSATGRDKAKGKDLDMQSAFGSSFIEYSADYLFGLKRVDPDQLVYRDYKIPLSLSMIKGRMTRPDSVQGFYFMGAYSFFEEMATGELKAVQAEISAAKKDMDNQKGDGGEARTAAPRTSKKPV